MINLHACYVAWQDSIAPTYQLTIHSPEFHLSIICSWHNEGECRMKGTPVDPTVMTFQDMFHYSIRHTKQIWLVTPTYSVFYTCWSCNKEMMIICCVEVLQPMQTNGVMSSTVSLSNLTTLLLGRLSPLSGQPVSLLPETDNCPSWISGRERMTVKIFHGQISTKRMLPTWLGSNSDLLINSRMHIELRTAGRNDDLEFYFPFNII